MGKIKPHLTDEAKEIVDKYIKENINVDKSVKKMCKDLNIFYHRNMARPYHTKYKGVFHTKENKSDFEFESETHTNQYDKVNVMSAQKPDGTIMTLKEYCEFYGLDYTEAKSYKLVTHTGIPYYNFASHNINESEVDFESLLEKVFDKYKEFIPKQHVSHAEEVSTGIMQIIISDTHIGMNPNPHGNSLYGGSWSKEDLLQRLDKIIDEAIRKTDLTWDCVQIIDLGDFLDGYDARTVRREHELPQNMSNEEMFDTGLEFKITLLDKVVDNVPAKKYVSYNVCNSNHSSSFDYMVNKAYEKVANCLYPDVDVICERKFIGHFEFGNWIEILCHGKDDKNLKFGFKPQLDSKGKDKIEEYIKHYELFKKGKFITFYKGDSHQCLFDSATSPDFDYFNFMSLAPSSDWVQTNFNRGRSGFTIITKDVFSYKREISNYQFEWDSNVLR